MFCTENCVRCGSDKVGKLEWLGVDENQHGVMISQTSEQDKAQGTINILQTAELRTNIVTNRESDEGASKQIIRIVHSRELQVGTRMRQT
jgi:hypothetical protein